MARRATTDGGGATLRSRHVQATRRAVLDAARALFGTKGYAQTSVDEIAAAAQVTKGAVYHHFSGKEDLFRAVWAEVEADAQARALADRDPALPPIDQIVAMVDGYLEAALDGEIRRITLIDGPALLGLDPEMPEGYEEMQAAGRAFIADAIQRGQIIDVDPAILLGLIGGIALQAGLQIARASDPDATRAALGRAIEAMLRGLAPRG
jgi:AcrR family transcriptional regulator